MLRVERKLLLQEFAAWIDYLYDVRNFAVPHQKHLYFAGLQKQGYFASGAMALVYEVIRNGHKYALKVRSHVTCAFSKGVIQWCDLPLVWLGSSLAKSHLRCLLFGSHGAQALHLFFIFAASLRTSCTGFCILERPHEPFRAHLIALLLLACLHVCACRVHLPAKESRYWA